MLRLKVSRFDWRALEKASGGKERAALLLRGRGKCGRIEDETDAGRGLS